MNIHTNDISYENDEEFATPIHSHDLIYCINKKGEVRSCGMKVHSDLLKKKHTIGMGLEGEYELETASSRDDLPTTLFTKHGIPLGIYVQPNRMSQHEHRYEEEEHEDIDDDLYDTLMDMANEAKQRTARRLTKKMQRYRGGNKKSKKNKDSL
jgi:hypothetical protein